MRARLVSTLLVLWIAALLPGKATAETYHVVDLGLLEGFTDGIAFGINDDGLVVGMLLAGATTRAFRFDAEHGLVLLDPLVGGTVSTAHAVNDGGAIAGSSNILEGGTNAVRWSGPGMPNLLGASADVSVGRVALAINASGAAAGTGTTLSFPFLSGALVWLADGIEISLDAAIGRGATATGINDAGQAVGFRTESPTVGSAFVWTEAEGATELIGLPDSTMTSAFGINAAGIAVGTSGTSWAGPTLATRWLTPSQPQSLGVLSGGTASIAKAINAGGTIVGLSDTDAGQHAMVWTAADGMHDLDALSDATQIGMTLGSALAINASGRIVGVGAIGGHEHGFLATPVPEVAGTWPAIAALFWLRRRRA
jgi:probable HAF family extracellular repeat protein